MIRKNAAVPDNFFELREMDSIQAYAMAYGDLIAKRYEDLNIVCFPRFPLDIDVDFFRSIQLPPQFKKVGTVNGIDKPILIRSGDKLIFDHTHILLQIFGGDRMIATYAQSQIRSVNDQIRRGLNQLFPRYRSLTEANITWRLTETVEEGMHADGFLGGKPTPPEAKGRFQRVKLFINIDSQPRKWWTSFTLGEALKKCRSKLPGSMPDDADMVATALSYGDLLADAPHHEVDIPPMGAVMGEAQAIFHSVRYGRRMIAAEFMCLTEHMLDPSKHIQARLPGWLGDAGIGISEAVA